MFMLRAPRVCGDDPPTRHLRLLESLVLPAYAGMILGLSVTISRRSRAPRVCGDDPESQAN